MRTEKRGLYIHVPFCVRKCNYCDFCSHAPDGEESVSRYVDALIREAEEYREERIAVDTVFFGGGTPSLLSPSDFSRLMRALSESFDISADAEITLEANPKTLTEEKLAAYTECGVKRISLGLQSIHENELKILGRIHTYNEFLETYGLCRAHGIANINVDLMYGLPEQTFHSFEKTLDAVIGLAPEHVSVYGLILEEGTPLYNRRRELSFPDEDSEYSMYMLADAKLLRAGYLHYEISNYSRRGYESRHNLKYWHSTEYVGLGLSAHSYLDGVRFSNPPDIEVYLSDNRERIIHEKLDVKSRADERVMLGLRLSEGISLTEYKKDFGINLLERFGEKLERLAGLGYIKIQGDKLSLTAEGFYVSNYIINELTESP